MSRRVDCPRERHRLPYLSQDDAGSSDEGSHDPRPAHGFVIARSVIYALLHSVTGYYNPILAYGEEKAVEDAKAAGASGFLVVDLPPEEATRFRDLCFKSG